MQGVPRARTHTHTHTHTIGTVKRKGFTIIQLVIGMLIFAILTGIAFFGISIYTAQANETRVASDLGTFEVAIKDYMLNNPGACSDGTLSPAGLNHYLTKENTIALDEADPNKDDLGAEISVAVGVKGEAAYKKLSVLEDPWGHQYRVVIRNNADRTTEDGEYGAKGTDRAFIYVYSMGKDGKGAANDTKQDDSVLCVQYSDGEVYSHSYLPSDGKNQAIAAPAYTYWNKDENGKHSVMKDNIFAVGGVDPSKAPGKENSGSSDGSGGTTAGGAQGTQTSPGVSVPVGATYTLADGTTLEGNGINAFPVTPSKGDTYQEADYVYSYGKGWQKGFDNVTVEGGVDFGPSWSVMVNDKGRSEYSKIRSEIVGEPVTHMAYTFYECSALQTAPEIPDSVTNMRCAFCDCTALRGTPMIPQSVTSMRGTFSGCESLSTAPVIPSGVGDARATFARCSSLEDYVGNGDALGDFSNYKIPNGVMRMDGMFLSCVSIIEAPEIPDGVRSVERAFQGCTKLEVAPVIPSSVTNMILTFSGCESLVTYVGSESEDGDFSNYMIPGEVTDMRGTFNSCYSLTTAPMIPSSAKIMIGTFRNCHRLSGTVTINANPERYSVCLLNTKITEVTGATTLKDQIYATRWEN